MYKASCKKWLMASIICGVLKRKRKLALARREGQEEEERRRKEEEEEEEASPGQPYVWLKVKELVATISQWQKL